MASLDEKLGHMRLNADICLNKSVTIKVGHMRPNAEICLNKNVLIILLWIVADLGTNLSRKSQVLS